MLKKIILKDFESHEDTVVENLSPGFNIVCGPSNVGKTSIVRAVRLVAYNDFDPACVRTGCTKCEVTVETERGTVKVTRGTKDNLWEVTPIGKPTEYYDKIGTKSLPQVAEIMGMNIVTLGDVKIPVNIMDQLESHFMLAGVGDKDATGSMRAQIIDEISGLSGIEGVIKAVSLDNTRFGREVKESEEKMREIQGQIHSVQDIAREESVLKTAELSLKESEDCLITADAANRLFAEFEATRQEMAGISLQMSFIPDLDYAQSWLEAAETNLTSANAAAKILSEKDTIVSDINSLNKRLKAVPDTVKAGSSLAKAEKDAARANEATKILTEWDGLRDKVRELEGRILGMEQADMSPQIAEVEGTLESIKDIQKLISEGNILQKGIIVLQGKVGECDRLIAEAERERDEILATVEVCPLTMRAVSQQCLEDAR